MPSVRAANYSSQKQLFSVRWIIGIMVPLFFIAACLPEPPRPLKKATLDTPPAHLDVVRVGDGWEQEPSPPPAPGSDQPGVEDRSIAIDETAPSSGSTDAPPPASPQAGDQQASVDIALQFAAGKAGEWGLKDPKTELSLHSIRTDELGMTHVALQQMYRHIPVWNRGIIIHIAPSGQVQQADGRIIPTPEGVDSSPGIGPGDAMTAAGRSLPGDPDCATCQAETVIFVSGNGPRMAYRITAMTGSSERRTVFVDAGTGDILQQR